MNCNHCGAQLPENAAVCTACGTAINAAAANPAELPAKENVLLGIVGALIGALLGGASILLFSKLGYVASLSGVLIAACTLGGYKLLAKGMGKAGLAICIILMLVTPFLANAVDLVFSLYEETQMYGMTLMDTAEFLVDLIISEQEMMIAYLKDLGMLYLFVVLGAFGIAKKALKG